MFGLFSSIGELAHSVVKVVVTPVEVVAVLAYAVVKPVADGLGQLAKEVKDLVE